MTYASSNSDCPSGQGVTYASSNSDCPSGQGVAVDTTSSSDGDGDDSGASGRGTARDDASSQGDSPVRQRLALTLALDVSGNNPRRSLPGGAVLLSPYSVLTGHGPVGAGGTGAGSGPLWRQMQHDAESLRSQGIQLLKPVGSGTVSTVYLAMDRGHTCEGKPIQVGTGGNWEPGKQ